MKTLNLILTFVLLSVSVYSQTPQWRNLQNSPFFPNDRMEDVYFLNENTGWSVLYNIGKVLKRQMAETIGILFFTLPGGSFRSIGF
ncbi:MAG: hypothetical protein IPH77_18545 [Ignavibacteria bacterium]|nr:hypothetical protein [Ignavibacteria bacterium]